jgi:hypothetical protein
MVQWLWDILIIPVILQYTFHFLMQTWFIFKNHTNIRNVSLYNINYKLIMSKVSIHLNYILELVNIIYQANYM